MRKTCVVFLLLLGFICKGYAQESFSFRIHVQISSLKSNAKVILTLQEKNQWTEYPVESESGKFIISGKTGEPAFAYLVLKYGNELDKGPRPGNILELFVDHSIITVNAKDSLLTSSVTGGAVQSEFNSYQRLIADYKNQNLQAISKNQIIREFISQHPKSPISLFAIQNLSLDGSFALDPIEAQPLFDLLSPELKQTTTGRLLEKDIAIARNTSIGAVAPSFTQRDTSNHMVELNSFRGQYVLIDFWASWCKPCRADNPQLVKVFSQFKDKKFTILSVSLDNNKKNWQKAILKDRLEWTHVSDLQFWKNEVALLYGVKTVPQNFLIGPDGKIIDKGIKTEDLEKRVRELVDK